MHVKDKSVKLNWPPIRGGGGRVKCMSAKKRLADGKDLKTIIVVDMSTALKIKKESKSKAKAKDNYNLDEESNF